MSQPEKQENPFASPEDVEKRKKDPAKRNRFIVDLFHVNLIFFTLTLMLISMNSTSISNIELLIIILSWVGLVLSLIFRAMWKMPCFVLGLFLGLVLSQAAMIPLIDYLPADKIYITLGFTLFGLVIGIILDKNMKTAAEEKELTEE